MVLQELGERRRARAALQRAVYLQPDSFTLAHFALGNLRARRGAAGGGAAAFRTTRRDLLRGHPADEPLPESEGLTAGRLREIITSLTGRDATRERGFRHVAPASCANARRALARPPRTDRNRAPESLELLEFRLAGERYAVETRHVVRGASAARSHAAAGHAGVRARHRQPARPHPAGASTSRNSSRCPNRASPTCTASSWCTATTSSSACWPTWWWACASSRATACRRRLPTLSAIAAEYLKGVSEERLVVLDLDRDSLIGSENRRERRR